LWATGQLPTDSAGARTAVSFAEQVAFGEVMQEVFDRVWVANGQYCRCGDDEWAVVHACKSPCHQRAVGYQNNLSPSHKSYLVLARDQDLYLNLIDPPAPLFRLPSFIEFLAFAEKQWVSGRKLLIHCNQGESRAPSLALLFLAKRRAVLDDSSYSSARAGFEKLYPAYKPGRGIQKYFTANWGEIGGAGQHPVDKQMPVGPTGMSTVE
jgi:hypothetical protein